MKVSVQIVIEFVVVKDRAARAAVIGGQGGILHEHLQDWLRAGDGGIGYDCALILRRIVRVFVCREARAVSRRVRRIDVITHHLGRQRGAGRNGRAKNAVTRRAVAVQAVIIHAHTHLVGVHHPIEQAHRLQRAEGRQRLRSDVEVVIVLRRFGGMRGADNQRAEVGVAETVRPTGRRGGEIAARGQIVLNAGGNQFRQNQKIRVAGAGVQALDCQHVLPRTQQSQPGAKVELLEIAGIRIRARRDGG